MGDSGIMEAAPRRAKDGDFLQPQNHGDTSGLVLKVSKADVKQWESAGRSYVMTAYDSGDRTRVYARDNHTGQEGSLDIMHIDQDVFGYHPEIFGNPIFKAALGSDPKLSKTVFPYLDGIQH